MNGTNLFTPKVIKKQIRKNALNYYFVIEI